MSGHATIVFHRADPDRVAELVALLAREGFRREFGGAAPVSPLRLFHPYAKHFADTDTCRVLSDRIQRIDPDAGFTVAQDPTAEDPGEQTTHDPELGDFSGPADHHGRPLIAAADLRGVLIAARDARTEHDEVLVALDRLAGGPWQRQIALLRALHGTHLDALSTTRPRVRRRHR